ncbi:urease accessory protein UreF [Leptolyngbya ohadii]|uniref:urease accessory protein UreF n=1 Tax=Leptolyngbya ohadii TaxID=1962290 RepID=UPI000B599CFE|nr:urease accessory protein UreF [Leptolyngbya ohadii]
MLANSTPSLLRLLQLVSPALPVGAFSYSEGLETLVQTERITNAATLQQWLAQELQYGAIRVETAVLSQMYEWVKQSDLQQINVWNQWLSAFRETEELREQSWQMGRSLIRLLADLDPALQTVLSQIQEPCNFATAFAIAAAHWEIDRFSTVLGYLQSWAANLVNAGIRLIPLGQTQGQKLLLDLYPIIESSAKEAIDLPLDSLYCCSWGLTIASMNHETLYTRLFRS